MAAHSQALEERKGNCHIADGSAFASASGKVGDHSISDGSAFAGTMRKRFSGVASNIGNPTGICRATSGGHPEDGQYIPTTFQGKCSPELTSLGLLPAVFIPAVGAPTYLPHVHAPITSASLNSNKAASFTNTYPRYLLVNRRQCVCMGTSHSHSRVSPCHTNTL